MIEGRIIKGIGGFYYIETEKGLYECRARGIFRKNKITPLVGDFVKISVVDEDNKKGVVEEIQERKTELVRPPIANVNKALIVFAVKNPTPHLSLLDRFIVLAERENLEIVIILTKIDLDDDNTFEKIKNIYEPCGYKVIGVSNLENKNIDKVKETGLKPLFTEKGNVLFEQARLSLECKKLYADTIKPECFLDKESIEKWYGGAHGGFHKMYIVEIENIYSE